VVKVEKGSLGAFKEYMVSLQDGLTHDAVSVVNELAQSLPVAEVLGADGVQINRREMEEVFQQEVFLCQVTF
jgi:hypothetical protein